MICDNAGFHTSHEVIEYLWKHEGRIEVHLLPSLLPGLQPDRAGVVAPARGRSRGTIGARTWGNYWSRVFAWLEERNPFEIIKQALPP